MKESEPSTSSKASVSRRGFVKGSAVFGALVTSKTNPLYAQDKTPPSEKIRVALIGCGAQGEKQTESVLGYIDGVEYVAVCDIWNGPSSNGQAMSRRIAKNTGAKKPLPLYGDHREMLEKEKDIDAVLIASPDFVHHVHTRDAMAAGKDVYCEKMMSNTIEGASDMVRSQREYSDRILQIGHQRRSNPRYIALKERIIDEEKAFGRLTHASAQWDRGTASGKIDIPTKKNQWPKLEVLIANGFADEGMTHEEAMHRFRNWRMFSKFGGGIISDLGAHQIDIFNWIFNTPPSAVMATGGVDYYPEYELPDNIMAIYEFDTPEGKARAYYQVLTTSSALGVFERFMGDQGSVEISELPKVNQAYPEANAPSWDRLVKLGLMVDDVKDLKYNPWDVPKTWGGPPKPWQISTKPSDVGVADSRATKALAAWELATVLKEKPHTPHLRNFFDCMRSRRHEDLNYPVEDAYRTCVTVLKIYDAVAAGRKIEFSPSDFVVPA